MDSSFLISPDVDYTQALPIQQKRIIAFINHFTMSTVSFLNTFAQTCETRLMEFDFKLQKVDASLKILESQLSSISSENFEDKDAEIVLPELQEQSESVEEVHNVEVESQIEEPKLSEDPKYSKYFKMVQVGVPLPAVKLKMQSEGLDPNILDQM